MNEADGALGHGVVLVVEGGQDPGQVAQGRDLIGQLGLSAEQAHCRRGYRFQGLALRQTRMKAH